MFGHTSHKDADACYISSSRTLFAVPSFPIALAVRRCLWRSDLQLQRPTLPSVSRRLSELHPLALQVAQGNSQSFLTFHSAWVVVCLKIAVLQSFRFIWFSTSFPSASSSASSAPNQPNCTPFSIVPLFHQPHYPFSFFLSSLFFVNFVAYLSSVSNALAVAMSSSTARHSVAASLASYDPNLVEVKSKVSHANSDD